MGRCGLVSVEGPVAAGDECQGKIGSGPGTQAGSTVSS